MNRRHEEEIARQTIEKIKSLQNIVQTPLYNLKHEDEFKIHITVDNTLAHGLFKPNPSIENGWLASEQTFRAMKKNIFALGENVDELMSPYTCHSCHSKMDQQFWHFCPYCGSQFLE